MESNNSYIYDIKLNKIFLSEKGTNDNMNFIDKSFYFIDNQYNVALPEELEETREIAFVDKKEQSLIRTNIGEITHSIKEEKNDYNSFLVKRKILIKKKLLKMIMRRRNLVIA